MITGSKGRKKSIHSLIDIATYKLKELLRASYFQSVAITPEYPSNTTTSFEPAMDERPNERIPYFT